MEELNIKTIRELAAVSFWRSRKEGEKEWSKGYFYGLFQGYKFAAGLKSKEGNEYAR